MKGISALLIATLAVATQGSYVPTSYWPSHWNSWNNGWTNGWNNGWNGHQVATYPYSKSWTSSWPATNLYSNGWDGHYGAVEKVSSWGQPWGTYGAGWGYQNVAKTVVPSSVKVSSWGQPWENFGASWGYQNVAKTVVVPSAKVNSWGLPWGSYGAGAYGWEQPEVIKTVVPVAKQVAYATPVGVEKVLVH